jgi:hypothetical protein
MSSTTAKMTTCDCCDKDYDITDLTDHHGEWLCSGCEEELGVKEDEEEEEVCSMGFHYCDDALAGKKCPHGLCDIPHCPKHTTEHHTIILKQKGLVKCDECGGIEGKNCDCEEGSAK